MDTTPSKNAQPAEGSAIRPVPKKRGRPPKKKPAGESPAASNDEAATVAAMNGGPRARPRRIVPAPPATATAVLTPTPMPQTNALNSLAQLVANNAAGSFAAGSDLPTTAHGGAAPPPPPGTRASRAEMMAFAQAMRARYKANMQLGNAPTAATGAVGLPPWSRFGVLAGTGVFPAPGAPPVMPGGPFPPGMPPMGVMPAMGVGAIPSVTAGPIQEISDANVALEKLFPHLDLDLFRKLFHDATNIDGFDLSNMTEQQRANWVIDNMDKIPLKKNGAELNGDDGGGEGSPEVVGVVPTSPTASPDSKRKKATRREELEIEDITDAQPSESELQQQALQSLIDEVITQIDAEIHSTESISIEAGSGRELMEHFVATKFFALRLATIKKIIDCCEGRMVPTAFCAFFADAGHLAPLRELLTCHGPKAEKEEWVSPSTERDLYSALRASYDRDVVEGTMPLIEHEWNRFQAALLGYKEKYPEVWRPGEAMRLKRIETAPFKRARGAARKNGLRMVECLECMDMVSASHVLSCEPSFPDDPNAPSTSTATFTSPGNDTSSMGHSLCEGCITDIINRRMQSTGAKLGQLAKCWNCPMQGCQNKVDVGSWLSTLFTRVNRKPLPPATRRSLHSLLDRSFDATPSTNTTLNEDSFVRVELPDDSVIHLSVKLASTTVGELKKLLARAMTGSVMRVEARLQRLFFAGLELDGGDACRLENYGMGGAGDEVRMKLAVKFEGALQTFQLDASYFDPSWNVDFRRIKADILPRQRGGLPYTRPLGCMRYAIRVVGRYDDGDTWLGQKGQLDTESREWPVAYHGTQALNVHDILLNGFDVEKGRRFAYGKGIYCSPTPAVALQYGSHYAYSGRHYRLIIQCRVNPAQLHRHPHDYWIVPDGSHIRPYAVCAYDASAA